MGVVSLCVKPQIWNPTVASMSGNGHSFLGKHIQPDALCLLPSNKLAKASMCRAEGWAVV